MGIFLFLFARRGKMSEMCCANQDPTVMLLTQMIDEFIARRIRA